MNKRFLPTSFMFLCMLWCAQSHLYDLHNISVTTRQSFIEACNNIDGKCQASPMTGMSWINPTQTTSHPVSTCDGHTIRHSRAEVSQYKIPIHIMHKHDIRKTFMVPVPTIAVTSMDHIISAPRTMALPAPEQGYVEPPLFGMPTARKIKRQPPEITPISKHHCIQQIVY